MNILTDKFQHVPGTTFKTRLRKPKEDEKAKHCYFCMAYCDHVLEARSVTRSDRKVSIPVCDKDKGVVMLKLSLVRL